MKGEILLLRHRAVDVVLAVAFRADLVTARGHPADVHIDAVAVDDGGDGIEEGEGVASRLGADGLGQLRRRQRAGGDDGEAGGGEGVDPLAHDLDIGMVADGFGDLGGETVPIHQIGRASCRESVCPYVEISVVGVYLNKKTATKTLVITTE